MYLSLFLSFSAYKRQLEFLHAASDVRDKRFDFVKNRFIDKMSPAPDLTPLLLSFSFCFSPIDPPLLVDVESHQNVASDDSEDLLYEIQTLSCFAMKV